MQQQRQAANERERLSNYKMIFNHNRTDRNVVHHIGDMNQICGHCSARKFTGETLGIYCCNEKINLQCMPQMATFLKKPDIWK